MKFILSYRPSVQVVLLDSQNRPLAFTMKRLHILRELQREMPELPLWCFMDGNIKRVPIELLELYDERYIFMLNTPDCA